ncbi:hypothetical protein C2S51_000480 [Perilla frutescens var. frutescens]|nr:hypothetical protein C2S51_000480 [Perilla frutescens var. frutescens]
MSDEDQKLGDLGIAEAASPISSRPPAPAGIGNANFEEMIQATAEGGGGSSSNRWPRQETLALLQIRSEMDIAFRDATLKGPLWDQVSRKLGELGYKRSAKKCKEKFENVHKYYKRTKEGRGGRQDGKSYKFFSQLEALHHTPSTSPLPRMPSVTATAAAVVSLPPPPPMMMMSQPDAVTSLPPTDHHASASLFGNVGISFSSDTSSSSGDDEEMEMEIELPDNRKRKRGSHGGGGESDERMMDFFEGLLKQVMQKQEAMQQRFLEAIEKREQDRMIREEAWKRQDMARIAREHDLMAQERTISASRDAAIIDFLQKITGQTIQLPAAPNPPQEQQQQPQSERRDHHHQHQHQQQPPQNMEVAETTTTTSDHAVLAATPQQQMMPVQDLAAAGGSNTEASSSRWPKAEVIALIKLRSGMESRYQEAGPKGPLWEEISAGMKQIGYSRSSKRCKEKWENINKYFKKVKESNKKRPEDAKTCPYFNELDALYRRKILGNTTSSSNLVIDAGAEQETKQRQDVGMLQPQSQDKDAGGKAQPLATSGAGAFSSNLFGEHSQSNVGGEKQPEDMLNKGHQQSDNYCNSINCSNSEDLDEDNYEEDDENEEYDEKTEEEMKMVYKIQFQRQNVGTSNGGGTTSPSFVAMVQ